MAIAYFHSKSLRTLVSAVSCHLLPLVATCCSLLPLDAALFRVMRHRIKEFTMSLSLNAATMNVLSGVASAQSKNQAAKAMFSSLKSGDLAGAQQAYKTFIGGQSSNSSLLNASSVFGQLGTALQKGDLASAQNLASSMQGGVGMPLATSTGSSSGTTGSTGSASGSSGSSGSSGASSSASSSSGSGNSSMSLTPAGLLSSMQTSNTTSLLNAINAQDAADAGGSSDNLYALLGVGNNINTSA